MFYHQRLFAAIFVSFPGTYSCTRGPVAQWTTRLTTNQKIAGSSPARIGNIFPWHEGIRGLRKWERHGMVTILVLYQLSCGAMDNASDYESEVCRFESCQDRHHFFQGMKGKR
jgi:hypothetical protein